MKEGSTDGDIFPNDENEEAVQGRPEETEETDWVPKEKN